MIEGKKSVLLTHRNSVHVYVPTCAKDFVCKGWGLEKEKEGEKTKKEEVENKHICFLTIVFFPPP